MKRPVLTFKCPVCSKTFTYQPKELEKKRIVCSCPSCQSLVTEETGKNWNPFEEDKNQFAFDCAELLMQGAMIGDIEEKLLLTHKDRDEKRIRANVIEISRKMQKLGFHRDYEKGGWIKLTKIFYIDEAIFVEDVECSNCNSRFPMRISVRRAEDKESNNSSEINR